MTTFSNDVLPVVQRADWVQGQLQGYWTYPSYAALPDDGNRYEVIQGVLYVAPSPSFYHQNANSWFTSYLKNHVQLPDLGKVVSAPMDVELAPGYIVQPDVVVVLKANEYRIQANKIAGSPDLVVEIASPSTATYDRSTKLAAYASSGVPEYWIADVDARTVELFVLQPDRTYRSQGIFRGKATLPSQIIPNFPVQVERFFA